MIAKSISTLKKKTGIVIRVGMAARLLISAIAKAPIVIPQNTKLLPPRKILNTVIGASTQPCMAKIAASHPKRFGSWALHQLKNFVRNETLRLADDKL